MGELTMTEVERLEKELTEVNRLQAELDERREAILTSNEEYAAYLNQYAAFYDDGLELSPRGYFAAFEELKAINVEFNKKDADIEALFQKHGKRMQQLERILAV